MIYQSYYRVQAMYEEFLFDCLFAFKSIVAIMSFRISNVFVSEGAQNCYSRAALSELKEIKKKKKKCAVLYI